MREQGHEAQHVEDIGLREADDRSISIHALAIGAIVVTKDEDYVDLATRIADTPVVLWLRLGNATNRALIFWLSPRWPQVLSHLNNGSRLVEVR